MSPLFVDVAVDVPLPRLFSYACPKGWAGRVGLGHLVLVPWRKGSKNGVVMGVSEQAPEGFTARELRGAFAREPLLDAAAIELARFMANYYRAPIGEVVRLFLPLGVDSLRVHVRAQTAPLDGLRGALAELGFPEKRLEQLSRHLCSSRFAEPFALARVRRTLDVDEQEQERLLEAGLLYPELSLASPSSGSEKLYAKLCEPLPPRRLGRVQAQVVELLLREGTQALDSLRQQLKVSLATLRSLELAGVLQLESEQSTDPFVHGPVSTWVRHELSDAQARVLGNINEAGDGFHAFLLHGVTGSGKTEVYLRVIEAQLALGRAALVILPEIALTPQVSALFRAAFGDAVAVLHSGLTAAQRNLAWLRIHRGEVRIVIGARSALFAPLKKLGVIVVDEEHDGSFKQSESPRYQGRDMALMRGKLCGCRVVLGSATPSLETYQLARLGKLSYLRLPERVGNRPMPTVELIDMSEEAQRVEEEEGQRRRLIFSKRLLDALDEVTEKGEQAIVLLNRRGHSTFIQCGYCGHALNCAACSVSLTYHRQGDLLQCHYCDHRERLPALCPRCGRPELGLFGLGTEQLVELLSAALPQRRVERLDRDMARGQQLQAVLDRFRGGEVDVLVGTQMVAKGHDVHNVTLVGVVLADLSLNLPDFRSTERTFQLLTQVAGRAGRGLLPGRVLIQTLSPTHPALEAASTHSYEAFAASELPLRQALGYPPFAFLVCVRSEALDAGLAEQRLRRLAELLRARPARGVQILGPAPSPLGRLRGRARFQLLLKGQQRPVMHALIGDALSALEKEAPASREVRLVVDIDPLDLL